MQIINENQVGYLVKNGQFQKILTAGKYRYPQWLGYTVFVTEAVGRVDTKELPLKVLAENPEFQRLTKMVEIGDNFICAHYINDALEEVIYASGRRYYWNIYEEHSFLLIDITNPIVDDNLPRSLFKTITKYYVQINVAAHEGALVYFNNRLQFLLTKGTYYFWNYLVDVTYNIINLESPYISCTAQGLTAEILADYPQIMEQLTAIDIPDGQIALHYVGGRLQDALTAGWYGFWHTSGQHTFELIDITDPLAANQLKEPVFQGIAKDLYTSYNIAPGEVGLLYLDNVYQDILKSGSYYFWRYQTKVDVQIYDLRLQPLEITGQEILTSDKVTLRLNFTCTYQINDPVALAQSFKDYKTQLYTYVQLILREYVGQYRLDDILAQKDQIAQKVLTLLREQNPFAITFTGAGLKDIILPGDIRDIMNTVLLAEKKAQANVITRREEVASTRSLLNTAKLMDENKTLYKLKELEYLERIAERVDSISVNGGGNLLEQLNLIFGGEKQA